METLNKKRVVSERQRVISERRRVALERQKTAMLYNVEVLKTKADAINEVCQQFGLSEPEWVPDADNAGKKEWDMCLLRFNWIPGEPYYVYQFRDRIRIDDAEAKYTEKFFIHNLILYGKKAIRVLGLVPAGEPAKPISDEELARREARRKLTSPPPITDAEYEDAARRRVAYLNDWKPAHQWVGDTRPSAKHSALGRVLTKLSAEMNTRIDVIDMQPFPINVYHRSVFERYMDTKSKYDKQQSTKQETQWTSDITTHSL